jgi:hypothetical protein
MVKKYPFQIDFVTLVKSYVVSGGCQIERFAKNRFEPSAKFVGRNIGVESLVDSASVIVCEYGCLERLLSLVFTCLSGLNP